MADDCNGIIDAAVVAVVADVCKCGGGAVRMCMIERGIRITRIERERERERTLSLLPFEADWNVTEVAPASSLKLHVLLNWLHHLEEE